MRWWAFWRRFWYGSGFIVLLLGVITGLYYMYGYTPANCLDGFMNGLERGLDCGGGCARVCTADVTAPSVKWSRSFRVTDGLYNAVAYVENRNLNVGVEKLSYTIRLFDKTGLITERTGETELPPNTVYPIFEGRLETEGRIPTNTVIEFEADPVWVSATPNGERYRTVERELIGADTRPMLTATLENDTLDEAKDVDVVATIFDAQGTGLTASRTKIPIFPGDSTKNITFTWQEPIAKTLRSCEVPSDIVLAIDLSGSMNNDGGTPPEPITSVLKAAEAFSGNLSEEDQLSLVTYATKANTVATLTKDHSAVGERIRNLIIDPAEERGSTNIGDAILKGHDELTSSRHTKGSRTVLILLTDGLATAGGEDPEAYALAAASTTKASQIEVFTIGLGESLNELFLKQLASDPGHYFKAPTTATLSDIYEKIVGAICEQGAAVIEIIAKPTATYKQLAP